jgi:short-subunit dehydrogenase
MQEREVSIITGGSRGIGLGIALKLGEEGHNIILTARDENNLKKAKESISKMGIDCEYYSGDAADENSVKEIVEKVLEKYGRIDHLINNAGIGIFKKVVDASLSDFKKQVDVNLFGVFNFTHSVLPSMIKRKKGSIINIASLAGKNSFIGGSMYSSTKHALLGFARSLMLEVREFNIRVATICPGSVDTSFSSGNSDPRSKGEILKPEDVADAVAAIIKMPARAMMSEIDLRPTNPK